MKLAAFLLAAPTFAQVWSQRGFLDTTAAFFPQHAANDSGHAIGEALLRWEPTVAPRTDMRIFSAFDARFDTHQQVEREFRVDWRDRRAQRPAVSLRRLSAQWRRSGVTVEAGKQFIRWGKADILNPVDRFAPRDYLNVTGNDFLGVTAARVTAERGSNTIDLVVAPWFTPSRTPLFNQRWVVLPEALAQIPLRDYGTRIPGRAQFGARWSHTGRGFETSAVFYDGFHHLPLLEAVLAPAPGFRRQHPKLRLYGADAAVPLPWFTIKSEAAWFSSRTLAADEYLIYVAQVERTKGEWVFVGGYAGEWTTARRNPFAFAPDRGFARSFLGRAAYTIDPRSSLAFEAAVRQSGQGAVVKSEYTRQLGAHWRAVAAFTLIRGREGDFLGQYRKNSHITAGLRYLF